jgi:hypothetical protein
VQDWKRPEFDLIPLLESMVKPGTLAAVSKVCVCVCVCVCVSLSRCSDSAQEVAVEPRSAKGYLLLMKTHNIARTVPAACVYCLYLT